MRRFRKTAAEPRLAFRGKTFYTSPGSSGRGLGEAMSGVPNRLLVCDAEARTIVRRFYRRTDLPAVSGCSARTTRLGPSDTMDMRWDA
jgi:hypothetical protein